MANSTRQKVYSEVVRRLTNVSLIGGYNGAFTMVDNLHAAVNSAASTCAWVQMGAEAFSPDDRTLGGGHKVALEITVGILVRGASSTMMTAANNALEDVRQAMGSDLSNWRGVTGVDFAGYDTAETDEGEFASKGLTIIVQPLAFTYSAGPADW